MAKQEYKKEQENENSSAQKMQDSVENQNENTENEAAQEECSPLSETEQLQAQLAEQKDKYIRLLAEFENYKKRTAKERWELIQTASKDIIVSLLDVLDDCDRAEKQMQSDTDIKHVIEGATLVFNKFKSILESKGVKVLESINTDFDVERHEAIAEIPAPNPEQSGKVLDEVQKGYWLNDKLIRHARVVVGK